MKKIFAVACAVLSSLILFAGCAENTDAPVTDGKSHIFYTNVPDGGYELKVNNFTLGEKIGGYVADTPQYEDINTQNYTTKGGSIYSMDTQATLVVAADFSDKATEDKCTEFVNAVAAELKEINDAISATEENSDISRFNAAAAGETIEINRITYEVLQEALYVYGITDGYYNPALYYNIHAYGFGNNVLDYPENSSQLPSDGLISKYTDLAKHFADLVFILDEDKYYVTKPEYTVEADGEVLSLKIDLGGIGKGYAVDKVDELFDEYGFKFGYFNFGSSSILCKSHPTSGSYNLSFTNPRAPLGDPYLTMPIRCEKLSTSGDYENCYFIDGVRYCHIISPVTGKPVQTGIMTVTVIGGSAAQDDALTTAIMAMGKEEAIKFIEQKLTDRKVVFTCE